MKIPKEEFAEMDLESPLNPWQLQNCIRKYYCPLLERANACGYDTTGSCHDCYPYLKDALDITGQVKNIVGLTIWRLRDRATLLIDHRPDPTPSYGSDALAALASHPPGIVEK